MRIALVFPGQGSEDAGMGLELAAHDARARRLLELASAETGVDVARAIERGGRALARTEVIQPALLAVGLGMAHALAARGVAIAVATGHSLGELAAAGLALGLDDATSIALAAARGRAMSDAAQRAAGAMLAVRTDDRRALAPAIALGLALAAHNAPDEHVLSGPRDAIAAAERALALPTTRLPVAGPWHAPSMQPAADAFASALETTRVAADAATAPLFLSSTHARVLARAEIVPALSDALVSPVRFVETLHALDALAIDDVVCVAPSRVVRSMIRRTLRDRTLHTLDSVADLDDLCRRAAGRATPC